MPEPRTNWAGVAFASLVALCVVTMVVAALLTVKHERKMVKFGRCYVTHDNIAMCP